jgi:hypothetical protein
LARETRWLVRDRLDVFAKADQPLDPVSGKQLLSLVQRAIPRCDITLYIRDDTWFLDAPGYPVEYPFQAKQTSPTKDGS